MILLHSLTFLALVANDSLPELRRCSAPKVPLGFVQSSGTVALTVSRKGAVDTAGLVVTEVRRGTPEGLRSALVRQLPGCRFRAARFERRDTDMRISAAVHFSADTLRLEVLGALPDGEGVGVVASVFPVAAIPDTIEANDARLEELPRPFDCQLAPRDVVVTKTRVDGRFVDRSPSVIVPGLPPTPLPPGEAIVSYVVPVKGRVDAMTIGVRRSTSHRHATAARERVETCRWAPGRVGGVPVAVQVVSQERFD